MSLEEELKDSVEKTLQALLLTESLESPSPERKTTLLNSPPLLPLNQPKSSTWANQCIQGKRISDIKSANHNTTEQSGNVIHGYKLQYSCLVNFSKNQSQLTSFHGAFKPNVKFGNQANLRNATYLLSSVFTFTWENEGGGGHTNHET